MKKIILITCLIAFFSGTAFAQLDTVRSNKNEFSIGYGHLPPSSIPLSSRIYFTPDMDHLGAFFATYTRRLTKVIGIGATYCFDPRILNYSTNGWGTNNFPEYGQPVCRLNQSSHTLMFHLKINWLNTKYVNLYSKTGIGCMAWSYHLTEYQPDLYEIVMPSNHFDYAYQITPIGIEVGTKQYAGFLQIGYGMEGMIGIGFRYGLKDREKTP